jgi:hypothetical protein
MEDIEDKRDVAAFWQWKTGVTTLKPSTYAFFFMAFQKVSWTSLVKSYLSVQGGPHTTSWKARHTRNIVDWQERDDQELRAPRT